ncbi:MAG: YfcE family phosphodiesterase [Flavobacteriaceae bacterium]|nr:YfcE family phosphodiesterase [Flavobacteriaceae bacterium]|tara:strand:- start:2355 stop:2873 length:519 start_codon:yes stop_codon:yes gene_type:complete
MKKILLISDTHGHIDEVIIKYLKWSDEVWHAGDIGCNKIINQIENYSFLRAVYGNIDNIHIRSIFPKNNIFRSEKLNVFITHIGGYPGNYSRHIPKLISKHKIKIFISGHSHILKIMRDEKYDLIHFNPGSAGIIGFHKQRTMIKFEIDKDQINNLSVIDMGKRGKINEYDQ